MKYWACCVSLLASGGLACGGAVETTLLNDSGEQPDASVQPDGPANDGTTQKDVGVSDAPTSKDVVIDVPIGPGDSHIQCGNTLTCSAQTQICCHHTQSVSGWQCVSSVADCAGFGDVPIGCSNHDNCVSQGAPSSICCANVTNNGTCSVATDVSCMATCDVQAGQIKVGCNTSDPCPSATPNCKVSTCSLPGYNICTP